MDVQCMRCGEPWDLDGVQHGDLSATERGRFWRGEGCPCCYGQPVDDEKTRSTALARETQAALLSVLGDDLDGLAAEMDDLGLV